MAVELATAYISLVPETKGLKNEIKKALGETGADSDKAGQSMGNKLMGGLKKTAKAGAIGAGAAAGGLFAKALHGGFGRLQAIEEAKVKFQTLGFTAQQQAGLIDDVTAAVKGTAFSTSEAADTAAVALAAGIKPGSQLTGVLKTVADSAAFSNKSFAEMSPAFTKAINSGKVMGDTLLQLGDNGVPAVSALSESMGKSREEIYKLASQGKISFEDLQKALDETMGGQALKAGDTFRGSLANLGTAFDRIGENILKGPFSLAPGVFKSFNEKVDEFASKVIGTMDLLASGQWNVDIGENLGMGADADFVNQVLRIRDIFTGATGDMKRAWDDFRAGMAGEDTDSIFGSLGNAIGKIGDSAVKASGPLAEIFASLAEAGASAAFVSLTGILNALAPILESVLVPALDKLAKLMRENQDAVNVLVGLFVGFKTLDTVAGKFTKVAGGAKDAVTGFKGIRDAAGKALPGLKSAIDGVKKLGPAASTAGDKLKSGLKTGLDVGARGASKLGGSMKTAAAFMGAQFAKAAEGAAKGIRAIGLAIKANPIGAIITAITLVVGALTWFFTQTETGKKIWAGFVEFLKMAWENWIKPIFDGIGVAFRWLWDNVINPVIGWIKDRWADLSAGIAWYWENVTKPTLDKLGEILNWLWNNVVNPVIGWIKDRWADLSNGIQWYWENVTKPTWDKLGEVLNWLWNSVINPVIGWIKDRWTDLSNGIQWAWNNIIKPAWDALGNALNWLWNTIISPVIGFIKAAWDSLGQAIQGVWNNVIKPAWDALGNALRALWDTVISPIIDWVKDKWQSLGDKISNVVETVAKPAFNALKDALDNVKGFFERVVDGIKRVWGSLKAALAEPINFLIRDVYNDGIKPAWDTIAHFLPLRPKEAMTLKPIGGYATGGAIHGPGTSTSDSILARLSTGEHVLDAKDVKAMGGQSAVYALRKWVEQGRAFSFDGERLVGMPNRMDNRAGDLAGAAPGLMLPGFKDGGEIKPMWEMQLERAHNWAHSRHGRPYVLGGSAHGSGGTDCSGFMSGIADVIGGGNGARQWATMDFNGNTNNQHPSGPQGFVAGLKAHTFSIGVTNGGPAGGHTAGTLGATSSVGAVNVESGGSPSMVKYGTGADGANGSYFRTHFHLPMGPGGAFVVGRGSGGPSPEQMKDFIKGKSHKIIDGILNPIGNKLPSPPPHWKGVPKGYFDKGKNGVKEKVDSVIDGLTDTVAGIYSAAQDIPVVGSVLRGAENMGRAVGNAVRSITEHDSGGWLPHNGMSVNHSGKPEPIFTHDQWQVLKRAVLSNEQWAAVAAPMVRELEKLANGERADDSPAPVEMPDGPVDVEVQDGAEVKVQDDAIGSKRSEKEPPDPQAVARDIARGIFEGQASDVRSVFGLPDIGSIPAVKAAQEADKALRDHEGTGPVMAEAAKSMSAVIPALVSAGGQAATAVATGNPAAAIGAIGEAGNSVNIVVDSTTRAFAEYRKLQAKEMAGNKGVR